MAEITWERLRDLHTTAARAALRARFPQRELLTQRKFSERCRAADIGTAMGVGGLQDVALEQLHRLRLVVPLVVSERGSDKLVPYAHDRYEPWDTHGSAGNEGGWVEVYYHHFQVVLVEWASLYFDPVRLYPGWYEMAAARGDSGKHLVEHAKHAMEAVSTPQSWTRIGEFYAVFPDLVLADQLAGGRVRGVLTFRSGSLAVHRPLREQSERWHRWRRRATSSVVAKRLEPRRARITECAQDLWNWQQLHDPLREWSDLIPFIEWSERERLRSRALASHYIREAASLLAELLVLGGEPNPWSVLDPGEEEWLVKRLGGPLDPRNAEQRAFVANRFGVNPIPAVIWFVEGESEATCLAELSQNENALFERAGVRVQVIGGDLRGVIHGLRTANLLSIWPCLLVDKADQGTTKMVERLMSRRLLTKEQVFFSEPRFEEANFTGAELGGADAAILASAGEDAAKGDAPHTVRKPDRIRWLVKSVLAPELESGGGAQRPIVRMVNEVLAKAQQVRQRRPKYHPNLWRGAKKSSGSA
jgi:hypothetical protein